MKQSLIDQLTAENDKLQSEIKYYRLAAKDAQRNYKLQTKLLNRVNAENIELKKQNLELHEYTRKINKEATSPPARSKHIFISYSQQRRTECIPYW